MTQEQTCLNHPDRKALSFCHHCGEHYCRECLKESSEFYYCARMDCRKALEAELHPPARGELVEPAPQATTARGGLVEEVESVEGAEPLPEDQCLMALYPNTAEFSAVKARLKAEGVEALPFGVTCGLIQEPFTVPVYLAVKKTDWEKADQTLKSLRAEGEPEPVDQAMGYDEMEEAQAAQAKLASSGIQSFLWDRLTPSGNYAQESFTLLTRSSDVEKATSLLIVPESE